MVREKRKGSQEKGFRVYTPQKNPKETMVMISTIAGAGIIGGVLVHPFVMVVALLFWIQYTAILSYLQFRRGSRHPWNSLTNAILHPQVRFFVFEFLGLLGLWTMIRYGTLIFGTAALLAWMLFAFNFYTYYQKRGKRA